METAATVSIGVRLLAKIMPWLVVRFFPVTKLDELLEVFPIPTGDALDVYFPGRRATCWLRVINLSPFELQIDRIEIKIVIGSVGVIIHKVLPDVIPSLGRAQLFCEDSFDADAAALTHSAEAKDARIELRGFVVCGNRSFPFSRHYDNLKGFRLQG